MATGHYAGCSGNPLDCWCEPRRYVYAGGVLIATFLIQAYGASRFHSLALLADAAHLGMDVLAYGIAIYVAFKVRGSENEQRLRRSGMVWSVLLLGLALGIMLSEVPERFSHPPEVNGVGMMVIAFIAAVGNVIQHRIVSGGEKHDTNRGLVIHILTDLVASVGIIIAGLLIIITGLRWLDAAATLLVIAWATVRSFKLLNGDGHDHHHGHAH